MLSQEQGGVPLWSGMSLAAGWPGSSKPPQTEWVLLKSVREEGAVGNHPPPTHTHTDALRNEDPQPPALWSCLKGLLLIWEFTCPQGSGQSEAERELLELKNLISCIFPSAHLPELLPVPLTCCTKAPSLT